MPEPSSKWPKALLFVFLVVRVICQAEVSTASAFWCPLRLQSMSSRLLSSCLLMLSVSLQDLQVVTAQGQMLAFWLLSCLYAPKISSVEMNRQNNEDHAAFAGGDRCRRSRPASYDGSHCRSEAEPDRHCGHCQGAPGPSASMRQAPLCITSFGLMISLTSQHTLHLRFRSMRSHQFMLAWADMVCHKYLAVGGIFTLVRSREVLADSGRLPK